MKILVTGANGFLGRGIVKRLLDDGMEVIATDRKIDRIDGRAETIAADLFEVEHPFAFFKKPDTMLHLTWRDGFVHSSDSHIEDLPKHKKFIENMLNEGLKSVAVMGSMHEIGFFEGSINEKTPCEPQSMYGIAKNALRQATYLMCKNHNALYKWMRGFYIVANDPYGSSIFSKISKASQEGQKTFPFTMGLNQFDFIDYAEFCKQVSAVIEQDEVDGIINICSGRPEKLSDRVERFIKDNRLNIKLEYGKFPDRPYDSKAIWGDDSKIMQIIKNHKVCSGD